MHQHASVLPLQYVHPSFGAISGHRWAISSRSASTTVLRRSGYDRATWFSTALPADRAPERHPGPAAQLRRHGAARRRHPRTALRRSGYDRATWFSTALPADRPAVTADRSGRRMNVLQGEDRCVLVYVAPEMGGNMNVAVALDGVALMGGPRAPRREPSCVGTSWGGSMASGALQRALGGEAGSTADRG